MNKTYNKYKNELGDYGIAENIHPRVKKTESKSTKQIKYEIALFIDELEDKYTLNGGNDYVSINQTINKLRKIIGE